LLRWAKECWFLSTKRRRFGLKRPAFPKEKSGKRHVEKRGKGEGHQPSRFCRGQHLGREKKKGDRRQAGIPTRRKLRPSVQREPGRHFKRRTSFVGALRKSVSGWAEDMTSFNPQEKKGAMEVSDFAERGEFFPLESCKGREALHDLNRGRAREIQKREMG